VIRRFLVSIVQNFFLFTPMLAEAATGAVETRHVVYPIRPLCSRWGVEFGEMSVEAIDLARRRVIARHRRSPARQQVHYDKLVLALGATPNVAVVPGAADHALTFKGAGDAVRIRNRVIDPFEAAALTDDPWVRHRLLTFVVVGAGHAGTELIAALEELTRGILEILETVPLLTPALDVVAGHHERYDGAGYPHGVRGDDIPLTARIFAAIDALDAMTHDRPYRRARPIEAALDAIRDEAGKQLDPRVVEVALAIPPARWAELLQCGR
jgi:hypothetical protein